MTQTPYKLLDYYRIEDAELFFGREEETQEMVGEILSTRLLVLFSPSGSGKTSLINAGVRPQLEEMDYKTIYTRLEAAPINSVCQAVSEAIDLPCSDKENLYEFMKKAAQTTGKPLVIFLDQFEEFFIVFHNQPELRKEFIQQVARIKYDDELPVFLVLSLREEYYANLHEFRKDITSIFQNNANIRLEAFDEKAARRAIENPIKAVGWTFEPGLVDKLIEDLNNDAAGIEPIMLQMFCSALWAQRPKESKEIPISTYYKVCGGSESIITKFIKQRLKKVHRKEHQLMVQVFEAMKTPDKTKRYRSLEDLQLQLDIKKTQRLKALLQQLSKLDVFRREKRGGTDWYEFKHDSIVSEINEWIKKFKERRTKTRMLYTTIILPVIILFLLLFTFLFIRFNTFYAEFTNPQYGYQVPEFVVTRGFNPFDERITTGYFLGDVKDQDIRTKFKISFWNKNNWSPLVDKLLPCKAGEFLYYEGKVEEGLDILINIIKNKNVTWKESLWILEKFGKSDKRVVDALLELLKVKEDNICCHAAEVLGKIAPPDKQIIGAMKDVLKFKDKGLDCRYYAAETLAKMGIFNNNVIDVLVEAINKKSYHRQVEIAIVLSNIVQMDNQLIKTLINTLDDEIKLVVEIVNTLVKIGKFNNRVINELTVAIKQSEKYKVRRYAAEILGKIGKSDNRIIEALEAGLEDEKPVVRYYAAESLARIGEIDNSVIEMLLSTIEDKKSDYQKKAAEIMGITEKTDNSVIDTLIKSLKDGPVSIALVKIGKLDKKVIRELKTLLKNKQSGVREEAALVLGKIGYSDNQVIEVLLTVLNNRDSNVWRQAPEAFGKIGCSDNQVINALLKAFATGDTGMQIEVAKALGKIGCSHQPVIEMMTTALENENAEVRSKAVEALGEIGYSDNRVIEMLTAAITDFDSTVRIKAAEALGKIFHSKSVIELIDQLKHPLNGYRRAGARALLWKKSVSQRLPEIRDKIKELKDNDKRPWVRLGAWEAYELIQLRIQRERIVSIYIIEANTFYRKKEFLAAKSKYQNAFNWGWGIRFAIPGKIAYVKFQQARCIAKRKQILPTLEYLEEAFQYNPALRETLKKEMTKKDSQWEFIKDNWYLNEILLKSSKTKYYFNTMM